MYSGVAQRRLLAVALLPAPHAAKDHARANEQTGAHGYKTDDLEHIEKSGPIWMSPSALR